jgi:hypothetical protein
VYNFFNPGYLPRPAITLKEQKSITPCATLHFLVSSPLFFSLLLSSFSSQLFIFHSLVLHRPSPPHLQSRRLVRLKSSPSLYPYNHGQIDLPLNFNINCFILFLDSPNLWACLTKTCTEQNRVVGLLVLKLVKSDYVI